MLREVADLEPLPLVTSTALQRQRSRQRFHQRGFTSAIGPEQADLVAVKQTPLDFFKNGLGLVAEICLFQMNQLSRLGIWLAKRKLEWRIDVGGGD